MARASLLAAFWRQNRLVPVLLLALLLINIGLKVWRGRMVRPQINHLQQNLGRQQQELERMRQLGARQDSPEAVYRRGREDLSRFYAMIPAKSDLTGLIEELFNMAHRAGLEIDRIGYDPQKLEDQPLLAYSLMFSVNGNYEQLKSFVYDIETSPRLIILDEIALSGAGEGERPVSLNLRFTTYFQADTT
ncbi:MAG: type 4a pilus biogenesis protein PilO [Geoalkalibacter sp.]|jgi:type IV pilus assembly protein PilO|uniref:type 4a pilus biogenesis protein PilO n=1 Tax=Geoalkalibacter sp. TaxID=3041440 RepID=UPI002A9CCB48|nr:type 4a pilus biogenesis protein PilO [Thermodesulfobacteriota bacterium]